ncbi:MAG: hypothetical protein WA802_09945 [Terracidiphilus sp.]
MSDLTWHTFPEVYAREPNGDEPMTFPHPKALSASLFLFLFTTFSHSSPAAAQYGMPEARAMSQRPNANSVILQGGTQAQTMQRLHVVRRYALQNLRSNPRVMVGEAQLDFTPLLDNPKALPNMATLLQAMPQHVQVQASTSEVSEVDQGLVIHHVLTYQILPGKCADAGAKAQLAEAGINCFSRGTVNERVAEFSSPRSPRYVADPGKRQAAIAAFQQKSAAADADASQHIAQLRKMLADPAQRAQIVAKVGQSEASRMSSLSDDDLKDEVINMSTQTVEETMFVPKLESSNYAHPKENLTTNASPAEMAAVQQIMRNGVSGGSPAAFPKLLKIIPSSALHASGSGPPHGDQTASLDMGPYIFLTGFTIGHDYEWQWGVSISINWCLVGCTSTYGIQLHAGFNYAFGLRFPIQTNLKYVVVVHPNNSAEAKLTPQFTPIEGDDNAFFASGLDASQLYNAQEIVAQVGADAGFDVNLPGFGNSQNFTVGVDFTQLLPAPYTGGRFQPPAPGTHGIDSNFVFNSIDLLGGLLDFGVVGGAVYPAIKVNLHSDSLQFTLNDELQHRSTQINSGQTVSVGDDPSPNGNYSRFSVGNPVYNLGFTLTPGLAPTVFVDVAVWSDQWQWPVWFPQLAISLPPGGMNFSCHDGTTCVIDFAPLYNAATGQEGNVARELEVADHTLTGGGCKPNGAEGNYLCPVDGMLGLCQTMMKNNAVMSCGALIPTSTDQILRRGGCTEDGQSGVFECPSGMMGLCQLYVKNKVVVSCRQK